MKVIRSHEEHKLEAAEETDMYILSKTGSVQQLCQRIILPNGGRTNQKGLTLSGITKQANVLERVYGTTLGEAKLMREVYKNVEIEVKGSRMSA